MQLIINADDLGRSKIINRSIIQMHSLGVVSSTTLMANGPQFSDAVDLLSENPELGVGVHLCLDGPYNSIRDHRTLIDLETGSFFENREVIRRIRKSAFDKDEIYKEFCLQIEKVKDKGIEVSHLDTHHNLHLYFPVLKQVIRVARRYKIHYIRSQRLDSCTSKSIINKLYRQIHQLYLNMGSKSVQGYYDPEMDECPDIEFNLSRLEHMLKNTKGTMEIMLHPMGEDDAETRFFAGSRVRNLLSRHSIISYSDLRTP